MKQNAKGTPLTKEHFSAVMKEFAQQWFNVQADLLTLQTALIESGVLTQAQLVQAHEKVAVQLKAVRDNLAAATPEKLLELLLPNHTQNNRRQWIYSEGWP